MTNRLADEPSPYLRQHRDNPVDWYPWGPEALARAKELDRPILLSVGYSACHWCHVMAHESFEDPATAALMNAGFINVKVDREERPDVDQLYQGVVQLMGRGGGWPLTVFLLPDLRPFFGGTYFPPEDRYGMPGFPHLLKSLLATWKERRADVEAQAGTFEEGLAQLAVHGLDAVPSALSGQDVVAAAQALARRVDPVHGGFGKGGPKFPNPMNVSVLLRGYRRSGDKGLLDPALRTLEAMARGGLYDPLGGGFHRYCVDGHWGVPHFEKMLYDNAQLLHVYSEAQALAPSPLWERVVRQTVGYLAREMTSPDGALYAAQDADSEGEEGKFFSWTPAQVDEALGPALGSVARAHFGVSAQGNFEHGSSVLSQAREPSSPEVESARQKLFDVREKREKPLRDDKVLAGWNGLAMRGLSYAGRIFDAPEWIERARVIAQFIEARLVRADGTLWRTYQAGQPRHEGMLEDYGDVASGLCALYQATFDERWLRLAEGLVDKAQTLFWDEDTRAYLTAPKGTADLVIASFALYDNATPSGASTLCEAQVALAALTGKSDLLARAAAYVERLREPMLDNPMGFGHLWLAADALADGAPELAIVGEEEARQALLRVASEGYTPTLALSRRLDRPAPAQGASAYLCHHFACEPPVQTAQELRSALSGLRAPAVAQ